MVTLSNMDPTATVDRQCNDELEELKIARSRSRLNFAKTKHNLICLSNDDIAKADVQAAQKALDAAMEQLVDIIERMAYCYAKVNDYHSASVCSDEMNTVEREYSDAMSKAECYVAKALSPAQSVTIPRPTLDDSTPVRTPSSYAGSNLPGRAHPVEQDLWRQLKRVSIPVFSGDKKNYEQWKASFIACVDSAPMSAEYKLLQMRQYLAGDALKSIELLGHSAASYGAAKQRLHRKYGGVRRQIAGQMEQIDDFKYVRYGNAKDIEKFADLLDITVINVKESGRYEELGYGSLYLKLVKKMSEGMIANYQRWVFENRRYENVETLREWVIREAEFQAIASETVRGLSDLESNSRRRSHGPVGNHGPQSYFSRAGKTNAKRCSHCNGQHGLWNCESFKQLDVSQRWQVAKDNKLCFRCLGDSHLGTACSRSRECGVDNCCKSHHRLLHQASQPRGHLSPVVIQSARSGPPVRVRSAVTSEPELAAAGVESSNVTMMSSEKCESFIGLRTVPVILKNGRKWLTVNALLDDGSTKTYLNADVAAELGLVGEPHRVSVGVLNGQKKIFDTLSVDVELCSMNNKINMVINAFTTEKVTGDLTVVDWQKHSQRWPHLKSINFPKIGPHRKVDMLIGIDYADLHLSKKEIRGEPGQPIARLTPLGWTCVGVTVQDDNPTSFISYFANDVNATLRKFWEVESVHNDD